MRSISRCVGKFGWQNVSGGVIRELSEADVKGMLMECEVKSSCAFLKSKAKRRMMLKLRCGTAAFQIEMGRWHGLKTEERTCKECDSEAGS